MRKGGLHVPQLVVGGDDLGGAHQTGRDVRDVALEPHQRPGPGRGGLVQGGVTGAGGDKTRASGLLLAGDDGPGPALLGVQGPVVPGGALLGVGPHGSPRGGVGLRVPDGLSPEALVPLGLRAPPGGDGVDQLTVGEGVAPPMEVGFQVPRGPGGAGSDDEPRVRLVQRAQVRGREHAGVGDDGRAPRSCGPSGRPPRRG